MTENLTVTRNVVNAVNIPVISDIDNGYGNALNVMRTIREFENAGVSAVIIEDQASPKRCPAVANVVEIIPVDMAVGKIKAAIDARRDKNLLIIGRTDAMTENEALDRASAYVAAGADLIQPISKCFTNIEGLRKLREHCGVPLSLQLLGWLERDLQIPDIEAIAGIATHPFVPLMSAVQAMRDNLTTLARDRSSKALPRGVISHDKFAEFIGFGKIVELEQKYLQSHST
jgi:methylisocitrate lyase